MNQLIIDKLKSLGFKEYESKAFVVLLQGSIMSASEIAKKAGIIRNSIYDVLKSFVEKGYCNEIETNSVLQYQIIAPEVIFDKIEKDFNDKHKESLKLLKDTLKDVEPLYNTNSDKNEKELNVELIRGINKHRVAKYIDLLKATQKSLYGMYKLKGLVSEELDDIAKKIIKNKGTVRSIYYVSLDFKVMKDSKAESANIEDLARIIESFEKNGEEVRLSENNIPNMTIFDKEKVFFNLGDKTVPVNRRADLIVKYDDFASYMEDLFSFYWENSMSLEEFKIRNIYNISNN